MIDPVADLLTRIRNASMANHSSTRAPYSKMKEHVVNILKDEGYVGEFEVSGEGVDKCLIVHLKYMDNNKSVIKSIKKVSKPGRRVYSGSKEIAKVNQGLGVAVVSTSKGIVTDREARRLNVGGEVICEIW